MAVATDYVSIPFWEETNPDYFVIPSKDLAQDFVNRGIEESKLLPLGIPTSKSYRQAYEISKCKEELNLEQDKKYVLILTGSMGFGKVTEMLRRLLDEIKGITFIVSCGNNVKLYENLKETYIENDYVIPITFTNNLSKYMVCSEVVLSKPGGLTTTEICTLGKPFIHTMPIPGCENYNANFFSKREMSMKCDTVDEVVLNTKRLLEDIKLQKEMVHNQNKYINKNASIDIADRIIKECRGKDE